MKNKSLLLIAGLALAAPAALRAQVAISDVTNDGSTVYDFTNAETVTTAPVSGIGYSAQNGGVFNHYGPAAATLTVNGIYDAFNATPANPGTDNFTGLDNNQASAAEIAGNTAPVFGILNLSNGANIVAVTNANGIDIGRTLAFANGLTTTVRANNSIGAVRLLNGAVYTNTALGNAQYVNGYVSKTGNQAFTYPVGNQAGTELRTLAISAPATATTNLSIAYYQGDPGTALDPTGGAHPRSSINTTPLNGETLASVSPMAFWDWIPVVGTDNMTITVSLPAQAGNGSYSNAANIRLVGWNTANSQWELLGNSGASGLMAGSTLSGLTNAYTGRTMASYSAIGFGSINQVPLPIGLLSFSGRAQGCAVVLNWSTATENASDYFALERSADGKGWNEVRRIAAAGRSIEVLNYQTTDESPLAAQNYYRLKLADLGGSFRYSNVVSATPDCGHGADVLIAPNPFSESVTVSGLESGSALNVWSADGKLIYSTVATGRTAVISADNWAAGAYYVRVTGAGGREIAAKQIVKK